MIINITLTFDQWCSVVRTLVGHGGKLPVLFDEQSSATSQIDFSHSVPGAKTKQTMNSRGKQNDV